jgi:hypothetical protein
MTNTGMALLFLALASVASAQVANEYTVIDINGLTATELAALPYFDRYVPVKPTGASSDFTPTSRSGSGVVAGVRNPNATLGAFVKEGNQTNITAWGSYFWSYWIWDGQDNHYYSGSVTHSPARDVNVLGQIVGDSTLAGSGNSSSDYESHGYLRDTVSGEYLDLTPGAHRADFRGISDHGEIVGTRSTTNTFHAFRRKTDGTTFDFLSPGGSASPDVINNHGIVAGKVVTYGIPWVYHLFASAATNDMVQLPWPSQGTPDNGDIYDMNDHGLIVGRVYSASPVETQAVRWYPDGSGWATDDLNELLADGSGDFIIDSAIAINDAGHVIAKGHEDGVEPIVTHTLLLTPDVFPAPSVVTLSAVNIGPINATLRAKVNACNSTTALVFEYGFGSGYGTTLPTTGTYNGTAPSLVEAELTGLSAHTTYHFRGKATNSKGATSGEDLIFTTPYDYAIWAAEQFGTNTAIAGIDQNPDGDAAINLVEYAFGGQAMVPDDPADMSAMVEGDVFTLAFTRPTDRSGVSYFVEYATDLEGPWQAGTNFVETVGSTVHAGSSETVVVKSMASVGAQPVQFMRVRVSEP